MAVIDDIVKPRQEVLTEGIDGRVDIYKALSGEGIEANAKKFLEVTYLTEPLREVINEIKVKLDGKKGSKGVYVLSGGFGSGKSHHVLSLYHIFKTPDIGNAWLKNQDFEFVVPNNVKSVLIQALSSNPDYLWQPIFEALGYGNLNEKINRFPTHDEIKSVVGRHPVMIFLDEIEPWFDGLNDEKLENRNLNFIQNLIEVASDREMKLCVFISILPPSLVQSQAISGKVNRGDTYWYNLYEIKDKDQIVLYRLFHIKDKKHHESEVKKLVNEFISRYKQAGMFKDRTGDTKRRLEELKTKMFDSYPFHPQVLETLFERYGSSTSYQRTRGVLYLLSSVVRDLHDKKEMILLSDINPEKYSELTRLDTDLAEKVIEDIRKTKELSVKQSEKILSVVFIKSMGSMANQGASKQDILFGTIDSNTNINDIETGLMDIVSTAPHIDEREGKYHLQREVNILVIVENEARLLNEKPKIKEKIAQIIKDNIKIENVQTACFEIDGIDDKNQTKIVFALEEKSKEELKEIFSSKIYQNRIIFINPKCKDVLKSNGISMNVARILAIEEMLPFKSASNFDKYKKKLERRYEYDMSEIQKKLKEKYGKLIQWQESNNFMPINVDFDSGKISKKIEELFDISMFREKIIFLLNSRKKGENLTVGEIENHFYRTRGFPVVTDKQILKKAIESLVNDEKIVVISGSDIYRKGKNIAFLNGEYVIAKPDEIAEESGGVDVGPRTSIQMRDYNTYKTSPTNRDEKVKDTSVKINTQNENIKSLDQFDFEDFVIEESKPYSLQSRLDSEFDESSIIREITFTIKLELNGKDIKEIINEFIEKHENKIQSMKLSAKVVKK